MLPRPENNHYRRLHPQPNTSLSYFQGNCYLVYFFCILPVVFLIVLWIVISFYLN